MALLLTIQKAPDSVEIRQSSRQFGEEGGTIGRGQDNSWVLDDPERFLSSVHCEIMFENGQFYLIDRSTNGTFFNGASEPIGKGEKLPIHHNDSFVLGDYEMLVSEAASGVDALRHGQSVSGDPFGSVSAADMAHDDDIFSNSLPSDDFLSRPMPAADEMIESGSAEQDPLAALNKAQGGSGNLDSDSLFGSSGVDPFAGSTHSDQVDPLNQQISWPEPVSGQEISSGGVIPDDWDDETEASHGSKAGNFGESGNHDIPPPPGQARQAQPAVAAAGSRSVDYQLVSALGLNAANLDDAEIARISQQAGQLLREMVKGLMLVLASRNTIKNEFRMNVTTIQPKENNPLKFAPNVDDALEIMFLKQGNAYLQPVDAVRDGFESIAQHQLAILAGVKAAFRGVIERFEPATLEEHFEKLRKGAVLPVSNKAKNWESYIDHYNELVGDIDKSFKYLYGDEFVRAYEEQMKVMSVSKKAKQSR